MDLIELIDKLDLNVLLIRPIWEEQLQDCISRIRGPITVSLSKRMMTRQRRLGLRCTIQLLIAGTNIKSSF